MNVYVAPIVEGETEIRCIKPLLTRIWDELVRPADGARLCVLEPAPANRSSIVRPQHPDLEKRIKYAQRQVIECRNRPDYRRGFVLLLVDADEDCPAALGPQLLRQAQAVRADADIACVLAKRELENWFKAAAVSLAGKCGLPSDLTVPADPELGSGDAWLTEKMRSVDRKRKYTKPADALSLVEEMNLTECRDNSPSFRKLCREMAKRANQ